MEQIIIQKYSKQYSNKVIELILSIQRDEYHIEITKEDQPDLSEIEKVYQVSNGNFWLAVHNGQLVGTIALIDIGNKQVALRKMFVNKEFRGAAHGVAKLLLQEAIRWSIEHNVQEIYLGTTSKFLAAHRFYEKNGFEDINKQTLPENFPVMKVDSKFYKLAL